MKRGSLWYFAGVICMVWSFWSYDGGDDWKTLLCMIVFSIGCCIIGAINNLTENLFEDAGKYSIKALEFINKVLDSFIKSSDKTDKNDE